MNTTTPHLSSEAQVRAALATLAAQGYDLKDLVAQRAQREAKASRTPTELDHKYPLTTPASWVPHFEQGPPTLASNTLREGGRFALSPGQRSTLRDRYEMTPTKYVECTRIELFSGTNLIAAIVLRSDLHVPESNRKHILVHCRIDDVAQWLHSSNERDQEIEAEKDEQRAKQASNNPRQPVVPTKRKLEECYMEFL